MKKKIVASLLTALLIVSSVPASGAELLQPEEMSVVQTEESFDEETTETVSEETAEAVNEETEEVEEVVTESTEEQEEPTETFLDVNTDIETTEMESTEDTEEQTGEQDDIVLSEQEELERNAGNSSTVKNMTELNSALEAAKSASASNPYEIKLAAGTYAVSSNIKIPSYVTLNLGDADIQCSASDDYAIYLAPGTTNVSIIGGKIHGGGIYAKQAGVLDISNVRIDGYKENGIYATDSSQVKKISGVTCSGGVGGIYLKNTPAGDISGCSISNVSDYGIQIRGASATGIKNNTVTGKSAKEANNGIYITDGANVAAFEKNKVSKFSYGIYVRSATTGSVVNNEVRETGQHGIYYAQYSTVNGNIDSNIIDKFGTNGVKIVNYRVDGPEPTGLQLYTGCKVTGKISNNKISNGKGKGILITGPKETKAGSVVVGDIENNTITKCTGDGIGIYHASHCEAILKNTLDTIGGNNNGYAGDYGIIVDSMMKADTYCAKIEDNDIKNVTYAGIAIYSGPSGSKDKVFQDTAHVKGNISNNRLANCGLYPASKDWKTEESKGGKKGCLSGIYVDTHARVYGNICGNSVNKTGEHGVYIHLCSYVKNIYNNTINGCKETGIEVYKSIVTGDIYSNKITNSGTNGIAGGNGNVKGAVRDNTITNTGGCGIYMDNSTFPTITNNVMTNVKKNGIYVTDKSSSQKIVSNQIGMNREKDGCGIKVAEKSTVKNIQKNTIQGKMVYGIRIVCAYNNISITSNTITTSNASKKAFSPILLDGDKKYTFTVKKNTMTGNKSNYGIRVLNGKAAITENTVKKTTYPVYIEKNSMQVTVKDNVLSGNSKNLVKVANSKYAVAPINLSSAKSIKGKKAALVWKGVKDFKNYEVYQSTTENGSYKKVADSKNAKYTVAKLKKGATYYFKVCGVAKNGKVSVYTDKSNSKKVKITK